MVRAPPDMARRPVVQPRATVRRGIRFGGHDRLPRRLTGLGRWASVATFAGIMR